MACLCVLTCLVCVCSQNYLREKIVILSLFILYFSLKLGLSRKEIQEFSEESENIL